MKKTNQRLFYPQKVKRQLFCALVACAVCAIPVNAQSGTISLNKSNVSMHTIMQEVEGQSDYTFFYNDNQIKLDKKVSVKAQNATIEQVLAQMFKNSGYTYKIVNNQIIVSKANAVAAVEKQQQQQAKKVTGCVKDALGEPIIGASVVEKGAPTNGTITDFDGNFTLTVSGNELQISYIGYLPQVVKVQSGVTSYNVTLKEDTKTLDEVVVIGYGTQKKVNLTGAVASVSTDDIKDRVQTNVLSAVQGTVPGVTIISRPGSTPSINFRGRGNLGTSAPLYVIDGAIADATVFSNLDPNTIESISFLKDAASSAIYGSRAAYGVVLVTTKGGKAEKMNVAYSGYVGVKTPTYLPDVLDSWDYATLLNEAKYNANPSGGKNQAYTNEEIGWFRDGSNPDYYPNTNWADLVLDKHVLTTQHSLNFSGGSEKVRFFSSVGYVFNDNFMPGVTDDRYNLNLNLQSDVTKWLTLKTGVKYIRNSSDTKNGTPWIANFVLVPSIMVAQQSNGEWGSIAGGKDATQTFMNSNPLRTLSFDNWSKSTTENTMYDLGFDLKPIENLVISGQLDYKRYE
jgi:TonB-linked SusC/RagA family outer membrane protein